jgi:hypothetical protein
MELALMLRHTFTSGGLVALRLSLGRATQVPLSVWTSTASCHSRPLKREFLWALCGYGHLTTTRLLLREITQELSSGRVIRIGESQDAHVEMGDDDGPADAQLHNDETVGTGSSTVGGDADTGTHQSSTRQTKKDPYSDLLGLGKNVARLAVEKGYDSRPCPRFPCENIPFYVRAGPFPLYLISPLSHFLGVPTSWCTYIRACISRTSSPL